MSLDVTLYQEEFDDPPAARTEFLVAADLCDEGGFALAASALRERGSRPPRLATVYDANVTHNLTTMADAAGVYHACWRPEEAGLNRAADLVAPLEAGLRLLRSDPGRFRALDAPNGWGTYDNFVPWLESYLRACRDHPDALVSVSR